MSHPIVDIYIYIYLYYKEDVNVLHAWELYIDIKEYTLIILLYKLLFSKIYAIFPLQGTNKRDKS